MSIRHRFPIGLASLALCGVGFAQQTVKLDIDAQPLDRALNSWASQTGYQVLIPMGPAAKEKAAPSIKGQYTPEGALKVLLASSDLRYVFVNSRTVSIRAPLLAQAAPPASTGRGDPVREANTSVTPRAESSNAGDLEQVIVSSTRLNRENVPTPMLVMDAGTLREGARPNIVAALNDMPQFKTSLAPQSTGTSTLAAVWNIDLRGLGPTRTLTLFDGRRLESSVVRPDASIIPAILVDHIDVVTGSASAAWGSNAVAGVVNVVLDNKLDGARVGAQLGASDRGDSREQRVEAAFGNFFADERGHVLLGAEYIDNDGAGPRTTRKNVGRWSVVDNPNAASGQAPFILAPDVGFANVSLGGVILSGVNAGMTFNPDGTLRPFDAGRVSGGSSIGGEAPSFDDIAHLAAPSTRYSLFGRVSYDVTDSFKVTTDVLHSRVFNHFSSWLPDYSPGNITISVDNAFLPAAVRSSMIQAGQTSFTMGRFNSDFALMDMDYRRETTQATIAFESRLGDVWRLGGYVTHGAYDEDYDFGNARIASNFALAADSVISPTTGEPVCRATLTNPSLNCVPINLFGFDAPSAAARNYVTGTSMQRISQSLDAVAVTLRGEPFDLWAGPLSMAVGIEGRHETLDQDPSSTDRANGFGFFNNPAAYGKNTTREAFAEFQVPLIKDVPLLRDLQLNAAGRISDDVTGSIWSWKGGITNELVDGVQLRFTMSRDIRAPNLNELYADPIQDRVQVTDPVTGTGYFVSSFRGGNPNLEAEASDTLTAGFTIAPEGWGLRFSVDYFDIDIKNAISALSAQQIINLCSQGFQTACSAISRGSNGLISAVSATQLNLTNMQTNGVDVVFDYALPLQMPGKVRLRSAWTWVDKFETDNGLTKVDFLGSLGSAFALGVPRLSGNLAAHYEGDRLQANVRARFISSGSYDVTRSIHNNRIPSYTYVDLGVAYTFAELGGAAEPQLYANINNLLDKEPPIGSVFSPYYDVIGRYYAVGARMRF
jgi:iron complex outermembrane receptor protein